MSNDDSYVCNGGNYSISMTPQNLIVRAKGWRQGLQQTIPISNVQSVVVERKNLMPVAASAIILTIIGVVIKYNVLWFMLDLNQNMCWKISLFAFLPATFLAIPSVERILFVRVTIACFSRETWRVNFVRPSAGRDFAAKFLEFSGGI